VHFWQELSVAAATKSTPNNRESFFIAENMR